MSERSTLKLSHSEGVTLVGFHDASILDVVTIQRIAAELYELVEGQGRRKIVLDFAAVRFLSSQALGVLLTLKRKADKAGATIALAGIRPELLRVFQITNLDKLFPHFGAAGDAVDALSKGS
jgi:anti-sigma B factor antagonist